MLFGGLTNRPYPLPHKSGTAIFVLQTTVGTNYFGHYYLTHLLLDKLIETQKEGSMARAVFMSSTFEQLGNIDWNDLE